MRALIQRVCEASVSVDGETIGEIGKGLLILVCAMQGDTETNAIKLAKKIVRLRIFPDDSGKMNRALRDVGGSALVVSQFTLAADTSRGNRPGFSTAAPPDTGNRLYQFFAEQMRQNEITTKTGKFGADMQVALINDGPVTIWMEI